MKHNADLMAQDDEGNTPLHYAAKYEHADITY